MGDEVEVVAQRHKTLLSLAGWNCEIGGPRTTPTRNESGLLFLKSLCVLIENDSQFR
jgi:hypothetical protein